MDPFTIGLVITLVVLAVLYVFSRRIIVFVSTLLHVLFVGLLAISLAAIFTPDAFTYVADMSLRQAGTLQSIQSVDNSIKPILNAPKDFFDNLGNLFGGQTPNQNSDEQPGILQAGVYPGLVASVAVIYRLLALVLSIMGLVIIVYLNYATSGAMQSERLRKDLKLLEEKMLNLEAKANKVN